MLGAKTVAGNLTKQASITVFVEQKRPIHELTRKERIPKRLHVDGQEIPTDVIELGLVVPQASSFSTKRGQPTNDYFRRGTLTSFCISEFGVFGLGCAHSLGGGDKRIETSNDPVRLWSEQEKDWLPVGKTVFGIHGSGSGTDPEFGFIDAEIFSINDSKLASQVKRLPRQPIVRTIRRGAKVTGRTAVRITQELSWVQKPVLDRCMRMLSFKWILPER